MNIVIETTFGSYIVLRLLTETSISICLIYLGQRFLIRNHFYLPLWPATGLGLTVVFLRGYGSLLGSQLVQACPII